MPAPQPEQLSTSAKEYFSGLGIALPMQWQSMGPQFPGAFSPPELSTPANPSENLFHEPTLNRYHTQAAYLLGREYEIYIDGICTAISEAIDIWMLNATVVNVELAGTIGTVLPMSEFEGTGPDSEIVIEAGAGIGPELKPLILNTAPQATLKEQQYSLAIAGAVSANWDIWANGLTGLLTYPPFGPPGPNIPAPLITFTSPGEVNLAPENLSRQIYNHFMQLNGDEEALHAKALFDSIAHSFFINFQEYKINTVIAGVIMTPPVPPPPPEPPLEEEIEEEEEAPEEEEEETEEEETSEETASEEAEPEPEPEPDPEPEPLPGGVVIPSPGNFV